MELIRMLENTLENFKQDILTFNEAKQEILALHRKAVKRMHQKHIENILNMENEAA